MQYNSSKFRSGPSSLKQRLRRIFSQLADLGKMIFRRQTAKLHGLEQNEFDKKLVFSLSKSRIPTLGQLKYLDNFLSRREALVLRLAGAVLVVSFVILGTNFYLSHRQLLPAAGGEYNEGVIGSAKYINPLYSSINDVDADLVRLIYSSILKRGSDGRLVNDLADSIETGTDGKTYIVKLKQAVKWHNDSDLTAADVIFTFSAIKNPDYKSPLRPAFTGVEAEQLDDYTVRFNLSEAYAAFPELLTFGILSQELWQNIPANAAGLAELNLKPVGSGPYKIKSLVKDKNGVLKYYNLEPFKDYYDEPAKISTLQIRFFPTAEEAIAALSDHTIEGLSYLPYENKGEIASKSYYNFYELNLPQLTAVFFNLKSVAALQDKSVRQALAYGLNKKELVAATLGGSVRLVDGPILPDNFAFNPEIKKYQLNSAEAARLLDVAGWKERIVTKEEIAKAETDKDGSNDKTKLAAEKLLAMGEGRWREKNGEFLQLTLTTVDNGDYPRVAEAIKNYWQNNLQAKTTLELIPAANMQGEIIKPRKYQALLYGEILSADPDEYAYWHSTKIGEGGLNLSNYSSKAVDKALEDGRLESDPAKRLEQYKVFQATLTEDLPAIFLYSPFYTYVQDRRIKNFTATSIVVPSDRLAEISQWYINTAKKLVW